MANTTVSIRERFKTADGRWHWTPKVAIPNEKLKPGKAERKEKSYFVWTEKGEKREQALKGNFEAAVRAARAKE